jgi:hypothetical protein
MTQHLDDYAQKTQALVDTRRALEAVTKERDRLRKQNADLKTSVVTFCAPCAVLYAKDFGLPDGHIHARHYDILKDAGARMVAFTRHDPKPLDTPAAP